jgi:DNA repair protein RadD
MKYSLFDDQEELYLKIENALAAGEKRILAIGPTRFGKSAIISKLTETHYREGIWFLAHTDILINQMSEEYTNHGIYHNFIKAGRPEIISKVMVVSKDTLVSRIDRYIKTGKRPGKYIIADEAHLFEAETFQMIKNAFPECVLIGFTATACRLDNKPLGNSFDIMLKGPSVRHLQKIKRLAPIKSIVAHSLDNIDMTDIENQVTQKYIIKDVVKHWERHAKNKKTLTFCASIDHAEKLAKQFNDCGYPTVATSSKDGEDTIKKKLADYYAGKYLNMCSVNLFIMGMTIKECECIVQARPTESYMIYKQQIGRGMMYIPGKTLINLDCCNNYSRHGDPSDDPDYQLHTDYTPVEISNVRRCEVCDNSYGKDDPACPYCGAEYIPRTVGARQLNEVDGIMIEVDNQNVINNNYLTSLILRDAQTAEQAQQIAEKIGFTAEQGLFIWVNVLRRSA